MLWRMSVNLLSTPTIAGVNCRLHDMGCKLLIHVLAWSGLRA